MVLKTSLLKSTHAARMLKGGIKPSSNCVDFHFLTCCWLNRGVIRRRIETKGSRRQWSGCQATQVNYGSSKWRFYFGYTISRTYVSLCVLNSERCTQDVGHVLYNTLRKSFLQILSSRAYVLMMQGKFSWVHRMPCIGKTNELKRPSY